MTTSWEKGNQMSDKKEKAIPFRGLGVPANLLSGRRRSPEEEVQYERSRDYWRRKIQPHLDAIEASERLTAEDYAVVRTVLRK
jgi:hypothetical protein